MSKLYTSKLDNLEEMDKFLEYILRLNHDEIDHLNRSMANKEVNLIIKNSTKKSSGLKCFTGEL